MKILHSKAKTYFKRNNCFQSKENTRYQCRFSKKIKKMAEKTAKKQSTQPFCIDFPRNSDNRIVSAQTKQYRIYVGIEGADVVKAVAYTKIRYVDMNIHW